MRPFQRWATLLVGVAGLAGLGGTMAMNATPVSAYMTMCCQFERNQAPQLVAAIWPQHWFDSSSWFENAVIDGINAWNRFSISSPWPGCNGNPSGRGPGSSTQKTRR